MRLRPLHLAVHLTPHVALGYFDYEGHFQILDEVYQVARMQTDPT
jgi:hypothetical protein